MPRRSSQEGSTQEGTQQQDDTTTNVEEAPVVLSSDADRSTYKENPDPNPNEITPPPGPSTIQELAKP